MTDRYEKIRQALAHEIRAAARLAPGEGIVDDGVARILALIRKEAHPAITHCDNCGCDWLDNGLNHVGCPYCKQNDWRAAFVAERATRYREGGMAIEQARIHAETDAALILTAALATQHKESDS